MVFVSSLIVGKNEFEFSVRIEIGVAALDQEQRPEI